MKHIKKTLLLVLAAILLSLPIGITAVQAQAPSDSTRPSANRFSNAGSSGDTSTAPASKASVPASRARTNASTDPWYMLALASFLSLRYLFWILGFIAIFCVLSLIFAHTMYRNHQPQSAHGAARWSVFWALMICSLLPWVLFFFLTWSFIAWLLVSLPFTVLTLVLLVILLTNRPAQVR